MLFLFQLNYYLGAKIVKAYKADISFILSKAVISANPPLKRHLKIKWMSGCLGLILLGLHFNKNYENL